MLTWTIQIAIISFILIFLVHHLFHFFKMTLTVPKIKDLVNAPPQKYENIYNIINKQNNQEQDYTLIDLLPKKDETNMKSELKSFLKSQLHNTNEGTSIEALDSANSYSTY
jgi:hypothetical protein